MSVCLEHLRNLTVKNKLERDRARIYFRRDVKTLTNDQIQNEIEPQILIMLKDSSSWLSRQAALISAAEILEFSDEHENVQQLSSKTKSVLFDLCLNLLSDNESRVRQACCSVLSCLCHQNLDEIYAGKLQPHILEQIDDILTIDKKFLVQEVLLLRKKVGGRVRERNAMGDANFDSSGGENNSDSDNADSDSDNDFMVNTSNKNAKEICQDTAGWKALETYFLLLEAIMIKCKTNFQKYLNEALLELLYSALRHKNRFIRETSFRVCSAILDCFTEYKDFAKYSHNFVLRLATGLADNWSQVRMSSSIATRKFIRLCDADARMDHYAVLSPRMCLNRYYVAEGVRIYSQQSWREGMQNDGPKIIEKYISETVDFYIEQADADNHAVREAALACIAEIAVKLNSDVVRPYVEQLLSTLITCSRDESWPVRAASCVASGRFIKAFPKECQSRLSEFYEICFNMLGDSVWSVREDAAMAIGNSIDGYGEEEFEKIYQRVLVDMNAVKNQPEDSERFSNLAPGETTFGVAKEKHDNDPALHTDQMTFSCGSLAPKLKKGGLVDRVKKCQPWEKSDGCIYLVRELITRYPKRTGELLSSLADISMLRHYTHHYQLLFTVWKQLPKIANLLGKRNFKPHLEPFFEPLFYSLKCENRLTNESAKDCLNFLRKFLGESILTSRIENFNPGYMKSYHMFVDNETDGDRFRTF